MTLKDFLIDRIVLNYDSVPELPFDAILKDEAGNDLEFENYKVNKIEEHTMWITHGADWQDPKQAIYEFNGKDMLTLVGEGTRPDI